MELPKILIKLAILLSLVKSLIMNGIVEVIPGVGFLGAEVSNYTVV